MKLTPKEQFLIAHIGQLQRSLIKISKVQSDDLMLEIDQIIEYSKEVVKIAED